VGKNEAAIVLGGTDMVEISRLERNGVDATDAELIARETLGVLSAMPDRGLVVVNYNGVDSAAHRRDVLATIAAVQAADRMVGQIIRATDLGDTLVVIAADHGTNPLTGRHNPVPTPLVLISGCILGRAHLGVVHNLEIAVTIAAALGLNLPAAALGRDLLALAVAGSTTGDYRQTLDSQFNAYLAGQSKRHLVAHED
jgi:phosphopentomutase